MRFTVIVLVLASLIMAFAGCNDKNTINSIPKHHFVYPVFRLVYDNGYRTLGIDSIQMTFEPSSSGYRVYNTIYDTVITKVYHIANDVTKVDSVYQSGVVVTYDTVDVPNFGPANGVQIYSDKQGFIGGLAAGTYYTGAYLMIDTIYIKRDSATNNVLLTDTSRSVDTTSVHFSFDPLGQYAFHFNHDEPFVFRDSFRLEYARTIDSAWQMLSSDTIRVSDSLDPLHPPETVLDSVAIITNLDDTLWFGADSVLHEPLTYGLWFDTIIAIIPPGQSVPYPPSMTIKDTLVWGFWNRVDSFFVPADSSIWCESGIRIDSIWNYSNNLPELTLDTVVVYSHCIKDSPLSRARKRTYRHNGWGGYDTTVYFFYPDTVKKIIFAADSVTIVNTETADTNRAVIYFDNGDTVTTVMQIKNQTITMPSVEEFPDYRYTIKKQ